MLLAVMDPEGSCLRRTDRLTMRTCEQGGSLIMIMKCMLYHVILL